MKNWKSLFSFIILIQLAFAAFDLKAQSEIGIFQDFEFRAEAGSPLHALQAYRLSANGAMTRLMVVTPSGRTVVLTDIVSPQEGTISSRILDDSTDTWLEIEVRLKQGDTINQFSSANNFAQLEPLPVVLRTSSGRRWVGTSSLPDGEGGYSIVLPSLSADLEVLSEELPAGFSIALTFLLEALPEETDLSERMVGKTPPATWGALVKALRPLVELDAKAVESLKWSLVSGRYKKFLDDSDFEFLSEFRSLENADPLSDFDRLLDSAENDRETPSHGGSSSPLGKAALPRSASPGEFATSRTTDGG